MQFKSAHASLIQVLQNHKWAGAAGLLCLASYLYLGSQSTSYAEAQLFDLLAVAFVSGLTTFTLWWHYERTSQQLPIALLLGFALLFRMVGILSFPVLEDDFYRYLWDGYMWVEHGSPYGIAPVEFFSHSGLSETFEDILSGINHPEVATIYGPVCQWFFALAYLIAPGEIWPLQLLFSIADLLLILLLLRLTRANNVMLYAWAPLVIKEFAFTAHPDVVGAMFLVAALVASQRGRCSYAAILLGLATGVKIFALIAAPFLFRFRWRSWAIFSVSLALLAFPFSIRAAWLPGGLSEMAANWFFNAPVYYLLQYTLSITAAKVLLLSLFCLFSLWLFCRESGFSGNQGKPLANLSAELEAGKPRRIFRGDWLFAAFFLVLPAFNPWYFVWLLPFAAIYPSCWAWAASLALLLSYASGVNLQASELGLYEHTPQLLAIEFAIIAAAALYDLYAKRKNRFSSA